MRRSELQGDFIEAYSPAKRHEREETEHFHPFAYEERMARNNVSLEIFWSRDAYLEDTANLPSPEVIAAKIVEGPGRRR